MVNSITILLLTLSVSSFAQISVGIKAGANLNHTVRTLDPFPFSHTERLTGFHVGVYGKIKLGEKFSFMPDLQYIQRGYGTRHSGSDKGKITLHYLELPLAISFIPVKWVGFELGVYTSLKISASSELEYESFYLDYYKTSDSGFIGGIRLNLTNKIGLTTRYFYGVTPFTDAAVIFNNVPFGSIEEFSRNLQFSICYEIF